MSGHIVWLASYPKSGNTLLRSILTALYFTEDGQFNLDQLKKIGQFDSVGRIKKYFEVFKINNKNEITNKKIFENLSLLQSREYLDLTNKELVFLKTHSGLFNVFDFPFTTEKATKAIIYLIRDPRDVCISWSKHSGKTIDESVNFMLNDFQGLGWNDIDNYFTDDKRPMSYLSSWDRHVMSWNVADWKVPRLSIKYEDLVYDKEKIIRNLISFFKINFDINVENEDEKIQNVLESTKFEKLKNEEKKKGFAEATEYSDFFNTGKKNQWKKILSLENIKKLEKKFSYVMKKYDYEVSN